MTRRQNILFVVHRVPFPPDRGDRIRSFHLLKFLASRANVWLATLSDEDVAPESLKELKSYCNEVSIEPLNLTRYAQGALTLACGSSATEGLFLSKRLKRTIKNWTSKVQFDAVVGFCSSVAPYLDLPEFESVPKYVDLVDVDSEKFFEYAATKGGAKGLLYGIEAKRVRKLESRLGRECAGVTFVTEPESEIYRSFMPTANIRYAINGIDLDYFDCHEQHHAENSQAELKPPETDSQNCIFVGALDYLPNIQGILWFYKSVWPEIQKRFPQASLQIVGRNPAQEITALDSQMNVQVHANVPDVRPYYHAASVAIAPLIIARGLQNKILEAFAMRTPVVSTPNAVEGVSINREHAMIASDPQEWVDCIDQLFQSEPDRTRYANAGYDFVKKNHSWETCLQPFAELLNI